MRPLRAVWLPLALLATSFNASADVIRCENHAGKIIFTDRVSLCANKELAQTTDYTTEGSYNFYNEIPDLLQTHPEASFAGNGTQYCGPVSVSNSLAWLSNISDEYEQIELVKKLGSNTYMNTNLKSGTTVANLLKGVHKHALETWGSYKRLEYSGWSRAPKEFRSNLPKPTLGWILSGLHRQGGVWLNIGWYENRNGSYHRVGGHWVTLAGYENGQLVIHDPASRAGRTFANEFVSFSQLSGGTLHSSNGKYTSSARDHFVLEEGMHNPKKADTTIVDGAVVFEL